MEMTEMDRINKYLEFKDTRIRQLENGLKRIQNIAKAPASNRKFMQVAGPARQILNEIKLLNIEGN